MRSDFVKFGNFLSFSMMKRQQNNLNWPYFGPVVIDGSNKIRVIGEAFLVCETHEAYKAVIETLLEFTPSRTKESIFIIAGDCALNEDFLTSLNLPNATLILLRVGRLLRFFVVWVKRMFRFT